VPLRPPQQRLETLERMLVGLVAKQREEVVEPADSVLRRKR
jgi:hypothetical protein